MGHHFWQEISEVSFIAALKRKKNDSSIWPRFARAFPANRMCFDVSSYDVKLERAPDLGLKVAGASVLKGFLTAAGSNAGTCKVAKNPPGAVKDNGAKVFSGTKTFKTWSCISHALNW